MYDLIPTVMVDSSCMACLLNGKSRHPQSARLFADGTAPAGMCQLQISLPCRGYKSNKIRPMWHSPGENSGATFLDSISRMARRRSQVLFTSRVTPSGISWHQVKVLYQMWGKPQAPLPGTFGLLSWCRWRHNRWDLGDNKGCRLNKDSPRVHAKYQYRHFNSNETPVAAWSVLEKELHFSV